MKLTQSQGSSSLIIGGSVYPMAAGLCHFLLAERSTLRLSSGPATLELGAGTGVVGIFSALLGADCTLTDKPIARFATMPVSYAADGSLDVLSGESEVLIELLQQNAAANAPNAALPIRVAILDWGRSAHVTRALAASPDGGGFELLLGSDISYELASHASLAKAIKQLLSAHGVALLAHETRRTNGLGGDLQLDHLVSAAAAAGLDAELSPLAHVPEGSVGTLVRLSHATPP